MAVQDTIQKQTELHDPVTSWQKWKERLTPYGFIAPFFVGFLIFQLLPIAFSIYLSFAEWDGMGVIEFLGFKNFISMMADGKFWNALRVTFIITLFCTIVGTSLATLLAVLLENVDDGLASILRVVFFLPSVTSVVVIGYIWKQLYSTDYGFFNSALMQLGLPPQQWLADPKLALPALLIMLIWAGLGWDSLIITAGLRSIPDEIYDAGKVDGTNGWTQFWYITLPLLQPPLLFVLVTGVMFLWGIFAQPSILTGGGPLRHTQTIAMYLYDVGFRYHKFGYASAIAVILSLIMFVSSYLNFRFVRSEAEY